MDKEKIQEGVRLILEGIGEDIHREGLVETPDRIARMYEELAAGYTDDAAVHLKKRFHVDNNDMVMEKDIHFYSFCEHHMLPFYGTAAVAYIPDGEVVGLSKIARTLEVFCKAVSITGTFDCADCRRIYGRIKAPWRHGADRSRAYVHDYAGN